MRIAFVNQPRDFIVASPAQRGSVTLVSWELARRLAVEHEVVVYAPCAPGQAFEERAEGRVTIRRTTRALRLVHRALDLGTGLLHLHPPYFTSRTYFAEYASAIARLLRADQPHVIHVQCASQFIPTLRRAMPDARIVLHVHDQLLTYVAGNRIEQRLAQADAIVTCSSYVTRRWRERFPALAEKIWTIGNGVDLDVFQPAPARPVPDREILYIGRISPEKGVHVLGEAFEQVVERVPDAMLSIIGPPGLFPFSHLWLLSHDENVASLKHFYGEGLLDTVRRQVLQGRRGYLDEILQSFSPRALARVNVAGLQEYTRVPEFYRRARVVAIPSVIPEPFSLPSVEALASGVPVVATCPGGMTANVQDGVTGRLVDRADVDGLAQALCEILTDDGTAAAMGRAARAAAVERFGWQDSVARLEDVYARITASRRAPATSTPRLAVVRSDRA
jgi:glycosyltransferase involved in cell wall biosynthesis